MNSDQNAFLQMCAAVKATCDAHATAWNSFQPFLDGYTRFLARMPDADSAIALQSTTSVGTTADKTVKRASLAAQLAQLADTLVLWAKVSTPRNPQLAADAHTAPSTFRMMSEEKLVGRAGKLLSLTPGSGARPPAPPAALVALGITPAFVTGLQDALAAFTTAIGTPRHIRAESVRGTQDLDAVIDDLHDILEEEMDPAARVLSYTQPAFYSEYRTVREIVAPSTNHRALEVTVTDAATREPLPGTEALITPGDISKTTAEDGGFYVESLAPGEYSMNLERPGYTKRTVEFAIVEGERTLLAETLTAG